jgi:TATA-box binding protein (TBP) (component of TFIID and TFIIIB)
MNTSQCPVCKSAFKFRSNKIFCCRKCKETDLKKPWKKYKKEICEECSFQPTHECQLDVDHIDANKSNNDPINLKTLCANCHRLKTHLFRDFVPTLQRPK